MHFALPADQGADVPRPGDVVTVTATYGAPHHLVADSALTNGTYRVRRTRAGDAWQARQEAPPAGPRPVGLGLPGVGAPAPVAVTRGCG